MDSANHNCKLNGVEERAQVVCSDLLDGAEQIGADIVLANITAEVLVLLAPSIPVYLKKGGVLILSGIIADRLEKVRAAYQSQGLEELKCRRKGEWFALVFRRAEA